jgi:ribosome-associated translation inhibitor RaiA
MNISITGHEDVRKHRFRDSVTNRLRRMLSLFSRRIARVDVAITDENGPRGGVDKHCRIRVCMPGVAPFVATATDANSWAAVNRAATRARRKVMTQLKRRRSQRERLRRTHRHKDVASDR